MKMCWLPFRHFLQDVIIEAVKRCFGDRAAPVIYLSGGGNAQSFAGRAAEKGLPEANVSFNR